VDLNLDCPNCQGSVVLRARMRSKGSLLGRCRSCDSAYRLSGGRLTALDIVPVRETSGRSFRWMVDAERRRTLGQTRECALGEH